MLADSLAADALALVLALVIRNFVFTVVRVDGQSMEPTLWHNDRMIVWRLGYEPKVGDIIVFNPPGYEDNIFWIKRVIATEGQKVEIDYSSNSVYVDDQKVDESFLGEEMIYMPHLEIEEMTVPEGCVFVLGDNRNHSTDSRVVGAISEDRIVGEAKLRFFPFNAIETY